MLLEFIEIEKPKSILFVSPGSLSLAIIKKFIKLFTELEKFNLNSRKKLKYFYNELTISHIYFITNNFIK